MKNQYFGDVNDFRKYGLLRCFGNAGFSLGICWMLTPDVSRNDGQKTAYLERPGSWRYCDPPLFDLLERCVRTRTRHVERIEESGLLPRGRYFSDILADGATSRTLYMAAARRALGPSDLWFFDPDNGLEVKSVPVGTTGSSRYLYWTEVERAWQAGASLLIFQHYAREPREAFAERLCGELTRRTGSSLVAAIHTSHVLFLFAGQPARTASFELACRSIERQWRGQISVKWRLAV